MGEAHLLFIARAGVFVTDRFKKQPTEHQPVGCFSVTFLSILLLHSDQLSFYDQAQVVLPFQGVVTVAGYEQEAFAIHRYFLFKKRERFVKESLLTNIS